MTATIQQFGACAFQFDGEGPAWPGLNHGSTWNGFDNVCVTRETFEAILRWLEADGCDAETIDGLRTIEPMPSGHISLGWGSTTTIVRDNRLTWYDLATLDVGTRVRFATAWDIFPQCVVPAGTVGTITENGLNEIWGGLLVTPDDPALREKLAAWDGDIQLGYNEGLDPGTDEPALDPAWLSLSPLALADKDSDDGR